MVAEVGPSYWSRVIGNTQHCVFWSFETSGCKCRTWTNSLAVPSYCIWWTYLWNPSIWHNLTRVSTTKWNMIGFFKLLISRFIVSVICSKYLWNLLCRHTLTSWNAHYVFFGVTGDFRASSFENSNCLIFGICKKYFRTHSSTLGPKFFVNIVGASMGSQWAPILCSAVALMREYNFSRFIPCYLSQPYFAHRYVDNRAHQEIFSFTR